jgi:hypothetical protein
MLPDYFADREGQQDISNPWEPAVEKTLSFYKKSFQKHHSMTSEEPMLAVYRGMVNFSPGWKGGMLHGY